MTRLSPLVEASGHFMRLGARLAIDQRAVTARGLDHVPLSGPVVLAVRHYHHLLDGLGLLAQVRRPLHVLIGLDWVSSSRTRWLMEWLARCSAWPVTLRSMEDRLAEAVSDQLAPSAYLEDEIRPYQQRAHRQCIDLLRQGRAVAIFPEGYPVIDPHTARKARAETLAPFKSGFARVAVAAARRQGQPVPVVPVGISTDEHDPRRLEFLYGAAQLVSGSTDVDTLIAQTFDAVAGLSTRTCCPPGRS